MKHRCFVFFVLFRLIAGTARPCGFSFYDDFLSVGIDLYELPEPLFASEIKSLLAPLPEGLTDYQPESKYGWNRMGALY